MSESEPEIVWRPNADAGDCTGTCSNCGEERVEPHSWMACAVRLAKVQVLDHDMAWDAGAEIARTEERARIVAWLREYARKDVATENKLAASGAYKSSSEAANWRMGIQAAADAIERGEGAVPTAGEERGR